MIDHYKAYLDARAIVEHLLFATAAKPQDFARSYHEGRSAEALRRLANELGYDISKRDTQQEAA